MKKHASSYPFETAILACQTQRNGVKDCVVNNARFAVFVYILLVRRKGVGQGPGSTTLSVLCCFGCLGFLNDVTLVKIRREHGEA